MSFGDNNSGFQAGIINGAVNTNFYHNASPERLETPPNPAALIPFSRDKDFVERGTILDQIYEKFTASGSRTVLVGLGGAGKSQLAIEYAYQTRDRSQETWVFWVHASNTARFEQSFREIANCVKIPGRQNPQANVFQLVHDWLHDDRKGKWLVILDNADDASFLVQAQSKGRDGQTSNNIENTRPLITYLPHCPNGSILVTTRSRDAALKLVEQRDIIAIGPMGMVEALALVEKKLEKCDNNDNIAELVEALEFMPLAIVQAASYISKRTPHYSLQDYLKDFRKNDRKRTSLLDHDSEQLRRDWEAKNSILITWQISFNYIRKIRSTAADLLSLMSFFDRQGIPEALLRSSDTHRNLHRNQKERSDDDDHSSISTAYSDDDTDKTSQSSINDEFEDDISLLQDYSFISVNANRTTFEMHRLVQLATRKWLEDQKQQEKWKQQFIKNLNEELPTGEYENWVQCQTLFPHAKLALLHEPEEQNSLQEWASILYKAGCYAWQMGNGKDAEKLSVKAMKVRKRIFGREHDDTLRSMAIVGLIYIFRGQWDAAEELQVQMMETCKKKLGVDHPFTLTSMNNLALTYSNQGRWDAAEELQVQVMDTRKKKLGLDHPRTLTSMGNLALTYSNQGRWDAAEELQVQVMETRKKKLGVDHPDTLTSMGNLALTYSNQGRWDAAEELEVQVMETCKKKLGVDHPDTLTSMGNLASTYRNQGRWNAAEELEVQVMETCKKKLGVDHPFTLTSMGNLASTYRNQGRWDAAEELQVQVMETCKKKLGVDHPDTLTSMNNLALTYSNQGRWDAAEELQVQVMETRKKKLGVDHPDTLTSMGNLASTYRNQGRWDAAEKLQVQVMETCKKKLGVDHPFTLTSMANLAYTWKEQDRHKEALKLMEECVVLRTRILGINHPETLSSHTNLLVWRTLELGIDASADRKLDAK
ncbi:putative tpr domain protein [Botrytis cinerea BcDW1]|uniref:Putative tpr domain protein n=1 Tax=Botryotinia fuckeliana (strain BcDW1) TaxID=1290391 RepID=M7TTW4_BOTF1|nr:putative tpr domain protein [Botrytis cinerea BcDW1]